MKNKKVHPPSKHGSILAYSLIVLAMMIAITATISLTTVLEKKNASSTDFSVQAYQTADSGVQLAIKKINGNLNGNIDEVFGNGNCEVENGFAIVKDQNLLSDNSAGSYNLSFYSDTAGATQITSCNALVNTIQSIKSVGNFHDTIRAVSVGVAAAAGGLGTDCHEVIAPKCAGAANCPSGEYINGVRTIWDYPNCDGNFIYSVTCCK